MNIDQRKEIESAHHRVTKQSLIKSGLECADGGYNQKNIFESSLQHLVGLFIAIFAVVNTGIKQRVLILLLKDLKTELSTGEFRACLAQAEWKEVIEERTMAEKMLIEEVEKLKSN
jgi:hypothetical protein